MSTGLFGDMNPTSTNGVTAAPTPPPAPVMADAERQAAIAAAKALLAAEEAATAADAAVVSLGFCSKCGTQLSPMNASRTPDGTVHHIGCTSMVAAPTPPPAPPVIVMPSISAVNPPDALPPTPAQIATPLSAEVIAQITDPEIKARAEVHAAAAAASAAAAPATAAKEKTSGRCSATGMKITITADEILEQRKKWPCPKCGKDMKLKPEKNAEGGFEVTITSHNMVKAEAVVAPPAVAVAPTPPPVPVAPVVAAPVPPAPPVPRTGTNIFITDEAGNRRELTQKEIDDAVAGKPMAPPAPPIAAPVPHVATGYASMASTLFGEGKYEASAAASLLAIAEILSRK